MTSGSHSLSAHTHTHKRNNQVETVELDTDDGSKLDENDNGQLHSGCSDEEFSDIEEEDQTEPCDVGNLMNSIQWNFEEMKEDFVDDTSPPAAYNGPTGNRRNVNCKFTDPLGCLKMCGLSHAFVAQLAASSNDYARKFILVDSCNPRMHGATWKNITTEEMHKLLGVMLHASLSPRDSGGHEACFQSTNKHVSGVEIQGTTGFARDYMSLKCFKQIQSAFHPEDKAAASVLQWDKCHQLRHAINTFNVAAKNVRHTPSCLSFDEGGCSCQSRFCPVHQCNKDKPNKFQVDFL